MLRTLIRRAPRWAFPAAFVLAGILGWHAIDHVKKITHGLTVVDCS